MPVAIQARREKESISKLPELFSTRKKKGPFYVFVPIFKKNFSLSHNPQRKEKDCLNCGTTVQGRYCHVCGQENVEPKETFWHMVTHFFKDITHFDGSFFTTLKDLLFKPGFLSKEYMKGRRASYLHPVRMYVFTSAVFFLLFFSLFRPTAVRTNFDDPIAKEERMALIQERERELKNEPGNAELLKQLELLKDTTRIVTFNDIILLSSGEFIKIDRRSYRNIGEYDSLQKTLPGPERDGWLKRIFIKKIINVNYRYRGNQKGAMEKLGKSLLHSLPYLLFISLPLFAILLKLVYIRRKWRLEFYFADHGVFAIHLYIFSFILLLAIFSLGGLRDLTGWTFINFIIFALFFVLLFYLYKAMRYFYGQGRGKTFIKFLFVSFWSMIMMIILLAFFLLFSVVTL